MVKQPSNGRISYSPRPDATPDGELNALAAVYKTVLATKKAAEPAPEPSGRDDAEEPKHGVATANLTK
jgi:hypothetical protein